MEQKKDLILSDDTSMKLGQMISYLNEWYPNGVEEIISPIEFEKYDRMLTLKDVKTGEELFDAIFEYGQRIDKDSTVYMCGVRNMELRGLIAKMYYIDEQIKDANAGLSDSEKPQKQ